MTTNRAKKIAAELVREGMLATYNTCRAASMIEEHLLDFCEEAKLNIMGPVGAMGCLVVGFLCGIAAGRLMF